MEKQKKEFQPLIVRWGKWRLMGVVLLIIVVWAVAYFMYPWFYISKPIEGWVVDAETKKPLADVIVMANWPLNVGTLGGNVEVGYLSAQEAVTDKNGRYYFPQWRSGLQTWGRVIGMHPNIRIYKKDYKVEYKTNGFRFPDHGIFIESVWNGKTIELEIFHGTVEERAFSMDRVDSHLDAYTRAREGSCRLITLPHIMRAMKEEQKIISDAGIREIFFSVKTVKRNMQTCDGIEEFNRVYNQ